MDAEEVLEESTGSRTEAGSAPAPDVKTGDDDNEPRTQTWSVVKGQSRNRVSWADLEDAEKIENGPSECYTGTSPECWSRALRARCSQACRI